MAVKNTTNTITQVNNNTTNELAEIGADVCAKLDVEKEVNKTLRIIAFEILVEIILFIVAF